MRARCAEPASSRTRPPEAGPPKGARSLVSRTATWRAHAWPGRGGARRPPPLPAAIDQGDGGADRGPIERSIERARPPGSQAWRTGRELAPQAHPEIMRAVRAHPRTPASVAGLKRPRQSSLAAGEFTRSTQSHTNSRRVVLTPALRALALCYFSSAAPSESPQASWPLCAQYRRC